MGGRHIAGSVDAGSKIKRLSRGSERLGGMRSGLSAVPPGHCFDASPSIGAAAARGGAHLAKKSFQTSKKGATPMESTCSFKSLREEACRAASLAKTSYLGRGRRDHSVCHNEMKFVRLAGWAVQTTCQQPPARRPWPLLVSCSLSPPLTDQSPCSACRQGLRGSL